MVSIFSGSHLRLYKEGFDDKIAVDPTEIGITKEDTMETIVEKLLVYFNVLNIPSIQVDLF